MKYVRTIAVLMTLLTLGSLNVVKIEAKNRAGNSYREANRQDKMISAKAIDRRAEAMKRKVRKAASHYEVTGKTYYISSNGNDSNDGLAPKQAIRSLDRLNSMELQPGDAVLFRRGDLWRGAILTRPGVSYSAYGKGEKPRLYGSPYDAAKVGTWVPTETPNVYMFSEELKDDVGTLVFNNGESCAYKVMMYKYKDGRTVHVDTHEPFSSYRDLKRDLEFYHDYMGTHRLYLCSTKGNPQKRFKSIEMLVRGNGIQARSNVTIDNLCIKYCGAHGIGSGTTKSLVVTNCELGWIGGSIQFESPSGYGQPTRFGNGIEIYGGCNYYRVENNYIYQVYDAGATHQFSTGGTNPVTDENVVYANNLIEDCVYCIEYFMGKSDNGATREMRNIVIRDNLLRRAGEGWGKQRPNKESPAVIKSWASRNCASDFVIKDNIFDRCTYDLLQIEADHKEWLPRMEGNTYIQYEGGQLGHIGSEHASYPFDEHAAEYLKKALGEEHAAVGTVKR